MYNDKKKLLDFEYKIIKTMTIYNYLNDGKSNLIVDMRAKRDKVLCFSYPIENLPMNSIEINEPTRLLLIYDDDQQIKDNKEHEKFYEFVLKNNFNGIFVIFDSNLKIFLEKYPFYIATDDPSTNLLIKTRFPLQIIEDKLFIGNYFNSRNLMQLSNLGIKSMISLLKEEDTELQKKFQNICFMETDEENHSEIDFKSIYDDYVDEIEDKSVPMLIYDFSGQISIAVAIYIIMKQKKWSIQLATAYIMKIVPDLNLPGWLYSQLNRIKS